MKPWQSWTFFYVLVALIAFLSADQWSSRLILFLVLIVPITAWASWKKREVENSDR